MSSSKIFKFVKFLYFFYLALLPSVAILAQRFGSEIPYSPILSAKFVGPLVFFGVLFVVAMYLGTLELIPFPDTLRSAFFTMFVPALIVGAYSIYFQLPIVDFFYIHFVSTVLGLLMLIAYSTRNETLDGMSVFAYSIFGVVFLSLTRVFVLPLLHMQPYVLSSILAASLSQALILSRYLESSDRQNENFLLFPIIIGMFAALISMGIRV